MPCIYPEEYFTVTQAVYFNGSEVHLLGIEELDLLNVGIYPNPTTNLVTIVFTQPSIDLRIYDSSGKLISEHQLNSKISYFNLSVVRYLKVEFMVTKFCYVYSIFLMRWIWNK